MFMPTICLKYKKVLQPFLKRTGRVTNKINSLKLNFKKFRHTKLKGERGILITYFNSVWKN